MHKIISVDKKNKQIWTADGTHTHTHTHIYIYIYIYIYMCVCVPSAVHICLFFLSTL
jgi:hypothetical protein